MEIIRDALSALYPSDALGGAVVMKTKDPTDYLQPGMEFGGQVEASSDGSDTSKGATANLAFGAVRDSLLLQAYYRDGPHDAVIDGCTRRIWALR